MKIVEALAMIIGTSLFLISLGALVIFGIISYNERTIQTLPILVSIAAVIVGAGLMVFGNKTKKRSIVDLTLDLIP